MGTDHNSSRTFRAIFALFMDEVLDHDPDDLLDTFSVQNMADCPQRDRCLVMRIM